ncbi:MAG: GrpB family protein [Oscillospiraceae bacterium]|nr:GrpB family protein [Oscillospiraceae bacterium]
MPKLENTLVVLPYDPNWKTEFERIRDYLMEQIGDLIVEIKHGGSTSVPGLAAKPIIDIFAMMESYDIFPEIVARLEKVGFVHEGDGGIKDREVFKRIIPDDFMNYHFYVCPKDSEENRRHTIFRNVLLNDKNIADEYGKLKMRLIEEVNGDRVLYTNSKTDFILGVIERHIDTEGHRMRIEKNRNLFYVLAGLVFSGADAYDHNDADVSALAERIGSLDISENIKSWFSRARTGQVEVNPYWPRGSALATACFFMDDGKFDINAFITFFESAAVSDPIGMNDFRAWISELPKVLSYMETLPDMQSLWDKYSRIIDIRAVKWTCIINEAVNTAQKFYGENAPEMSFSPNLFTVYSTDFVSIGNRIITIAAEPDVESMLHETLHTIIAAYRDKIMTFAEKYGLAGFANRDKMIEFGYMEDDSVASVTHVIEECFVRTVSVVLAGKSDERLRVHAEYGCDSVPFIAAHFKNIRPTVNGLGTFIDIIFKKMTAVFMEKEW